MFLTLMTSQISLLEGAITGNKTGFFFSMVGFYSKVLKKKKRKNL